MVDETPAIENPNVVWQPDGFLAAWRFAAAAHLEQRVPGSDLPYLTHVGAVAMEVMAAISALPVQRPDLAVQCAVLHDVLEDTETDYADIAEQFGTAVADGVAALTKNNDLVTKKEKMADSLARIALQPPEIAMVKLADRITNLQPPPAFWKPAKIAAYLEEAALLHRRLNHAHAILSRRLEQKMSEYRRFIIV